MKNRGENGDWDGDSPSTPDDAQDINTAETLQKRRYAKFLGGDIDASPALRDFVHDFLLLFDPLNPSAVSMGAYVRRTLKQFGVNDHRESDILAIAYLRAYKFLKAGGTEIVYPIAWTKRTTYNVIRELNRRPSHSKEFSLDLWGLDKNAPDLASQAGSHKIDTEILKHALALLTPKEQRLLTLKIVHELRWNEIREIFLQDGVMIPGTTPEKQEANLRKMKERALKHLRSSYHALRPLFEFEES